ncbi:hypothetical protein VaNZ11_012653, partial [Volvox africanus]
NTLKRRVKFVLLVNSGGSVVLISTPLSAPCQVMSYLQRFCQGSSLRHAAAAWRAGSAQLQAARVAMAASQRFNAAPPAYVAAPNSVPSFATSPSIPLSFAASGVQSTAGVAAAGTSGAVEGSDSGEAGNSMSGASHTGSLSGSKSLRKRRKRF